MGSCCLNQKSPRPFWKWNAQPASSITVCCSSFPSKTWALLASPFGAQNLSAQLDFEFKLRLGRRRLRGPSLLFLMVLLLVFLLVLLVLFFVHSVAVGTGQTQLQRFPCGRKSLSTVYGRSRAGRVERPKTPERSPSSHDTVTITAAPPLALPPAANTLEALRKKKEETPFLRRPMLLYRLTLTRLRSFHCPRGAPAPPQLTHGALQGKVSKNGRDTGRQAFSAPRKN